jgi:hypothetical protein
MNFNEFYSEHKRDLWILLIAILALLCLQYVHACTELWVSNNTVCNGYNYTITYYDYYQCNTTTSLPLNNGTIIPCTINITECSDNLCINPIKNDTQCCIVTPVVTCISYWYQLYNNNGTLIDNGIMQPFINNTYFYMFKQPIGTYYTKICDDSTRQLIVEGDNMIGLTGQTWLIITLILLFGLFMWLSFKFDPLFMLIDGIIFIYFAYYSYTLYSSWFITVLLSMIGALFIIVGVFAKIGLTTTN